jgi:hypothetical protein
MNSIDRLPQRVSRSKHRAPSKRKHKRELFHCWNVPPIIERGVDLRCVVVQRDRATYPSGSVVG